MSAHGLYLIHAGGRMETCSVSHTDIPPWTLEFENENLGRISFAGPDLFECLCQLRRWLAERDFRILCNGARIDAWASSMSRGMGGARKVYVTRMGLHTTRDDLVPIFGETTVDKLGSVEEQANYHTKWLESVL